jgi:hypothetical protein
MQKPRPMLGGRERCEPFDMAEITVVDVERVEAGIVDVPNLASELDPERATARSQTRDLLQRAIENLPEPFRVVLVMRMVEQLSARRTASSFGIHEVTGRARLHCAKQLMRAQLQTTLAFADHLRDKSTAGTVKFPMRTCPPSKKCGFEYRSTDLMGHVSLVIVRS